MKVKYWILLLSYLCLQFYTVDKLEKSILKLMKVTSIVFTGKQYIIN